MVQQQKQAARIESREQQSSKKAYAKPELTVHGAVEQLTEQVQPGPSQLKFVSKA